MALGPYHIIRAVPLSSLDLIT